MILQKQTNQHGQLCGYEFFCPGCQELHFIPTENYHIVWEFNGNEEKPTFRPSVKLGHPADADCHFVITDGKIAFCSDCKHHQQNLTVDMVPIP